MKKIILLCQIIFVAFFVIKAFSYMESMQIMPFSLSGIIQDQAIAQTPAKGAIAPVKEGRGTGDDALQQERDLLAKLQKKQKELETRETALKSEEQKILSLKKEVMDKIDELKVLENQLTEKLKTEKTYDDKHFKELAKVYEAAPPQKAAAMLDKLEVKTAAGITINMKRERAGMIWGFLSPQKAVDITNEISRKSRAAVE